jgi:lipopolysaccharide/colanic/teichoic acid biosynthesis glycosyltransferase
MKEISQYSWKRWTDVIGSILLLAVALPLWLIIPLVIKLDDGGPVIYRRRVMGKDGRQFDAFKFRTMVVNADEVMARNPQLQQEFEKNSKLQNDPRITRVGRLLRKTSLDEFPQLINVLFGQMSLIGPRMISPQELSRFGGQAKQLLSVKPGCSGPWVVSGRQDIPYEQRVELELNYIKNWSLSLDIRLLAKTAMAMLSMRGAY